MIIVSFSKPIGCGSQQDLCKESSFHDRSRQVKVTSSHEQIVYSCWKSLDHVDCHAVLCTTVLLYFFILNQKQHIVTFRTVERDSRSNIYYQNSSYDALRGSRLNINHKLACSTQNALRSSLDHKLACSTHNALRSSLDHKLACHTHIAIRWSWSSIDHKVI